MEAVRLLAVDDEAEFGELAGGIAQPDLVGVAAAGTAEDHHLGFQGDEADDGGSMAAARRSTTATCQVLCTSVNSNEGSAMNYSSK